MTTITSRPPLYYGTVCFILSARRSSDYTNCSTPWPTSTTHSHPHVPRFPPLFLSPHHAPLLPSLPPPSSSFLSCGFLPLHHRLSASSPFSPRPDGSQMRVSFCLETVMKTEILFPGWLLWVFSAVLRCCRVIDVAVVVLVSHFGLIDVSARIGADIANDFQLAHSSSWGKVNSFQPNCCRSPTSWRFHAAIISKAVTLFASAYFILRNVHSFLFQSTNSPQAEQFTNVTCFYKCRLLPEKEKPKKIYSI